MSCEVILLLGLVGGLAAGYVWGYMQAYTRGWGKGYDRALEIRTLRVEAGGVTLTVPERVIHNYLDQRDLIAVPKGVDFQPGKEQA